jgi:hypothetical protein
MAHVVDLENRVGAPRPVPADRLREGFLPVTTRYTLGLVQPGQWRLRFGPLTLLEFGDPEAGEHGVCWPIRGGLLAARAGGRVQIRWLDGELRGRVEDYAPRLPGPLYRLTQLPFHHAVMRLTLLQLRGRDPLPGEPAGRRSRSLAAAVDLALCTALASRAGHRRRLAVAAALYATYNLAAWSLAGKTLGGALFGLRVLSVDGSRITPPQALVRLLAGDQAAGTAVIRD